MENSIEWVQKMAMPMVRQLVGTILLERGLAGKIGWAGQMVHCCCLESNLELLKEDLFSLSGHLSVSLLEHLWDNLSASLLEHLSEHLSASLLGYLLENLTERSSEHSSEDLMERLSDYLLESCLESGLVLE